MKTAFSTIGCPEWSLSEILATAKDFGYDGIEIRGVSRDIYAPDIKEFSEAQLNTTMNKMKEMSLKIPIFSSEAAIFDKLHSKEALKEAKDYIDLASRAKVDNIRVLGDGAPEPQHPVDQGYIAEIMSVLCDYAAGKSVNVLIETNGFLSDSTEMLSIIRKTNRKNAGVIWDIHHTVRFGNEEPELTMNLIGEYIKHVHVKDSLADNGLIKYKMVGYGDIPVLEAVRELKSVGYGGFISLEWVKRWTPDLKEPGIVFPHFKYYMDNLLASI